MARKAGRPKQLRPHEVKLHLPKDPDLYKAKRLQWALHSLEKKMAKDITSVRMTEYNAVLTAFTEVVRELDKKGINYAKQRMDKQGMVQDESQDPEAEAGGDGSSGVGVGISPVNPLT